MLRHIIGIIHHSVMLRYEHYQHNSKSAVMARYIISTVIPPISTAALIQKHFSFCGAYL